MSFSTTKYTGPVVLVTLYWYETFLKTIFRTNVITSGAEPAYVTSVDTCPRYLFTYITRACTTRDFSAVPVTCLVTGDTIKSRFTFGFLTIRTVGTVARLHDRRHFLSLGEQTLKSYNKNDVWNVLLVRHFIVIVKFSPFLSLSFIIIIFFFWLILFRILVLLRSSSDIIVQK